MERNPSFAGSWETDGFRGYALLYPSYALCPTYELGRWQMDVGLRVGAVANGCRARPVPDYGLRTVSHRGAANLLWQSFLLCCSHEQFDRRFQPDDPFGEIFDLRLLVLDGLGE